MRAQFQIGSISSALGPAPPFSGYVLKFFDDFTSFAGDPNGAGGDWSTCYQPSGNRTNAGTGEQEYYGDSANGVNPFSIVNGTVLRITASKASVTGVNPLAQPYNSGFITTACATGSPGTFGMQYGYFEMRAKLPAGQGFWTAFWFALPTGFTASTEIDAFEQIGIGTSLDLNVHWGTTGAPSQSGPTVITVPDTSAGFNLFGVDVDPVNITFYFNRVSKLVVPTPVGFNTPLVILADFAVGGGFPGNPDVTTVFPAFYDIDYIAAWANASSTNITGSRVIP